MHARRLNRIARFLGSNGFYKEAYQIKKLSQNEEEKQEELERDQGSLETNQGEYEDIFPKSPDEILPPQKEELFQDHPPHDTDEDIAEEENDEQQWQNFLASLPQDEDDFQEPEDDDSLSGSGEVKWESKY